MIRVTSKTIYIKMLTSIIFPNIIFYILLEPSNTTRTVIPGALVQNTDENSTYMPIKFDLFFVKF